MSFWGWVDESGGESGDPVTHAEVADAARRNVWHDPSMERDRLFVAPLLARSEPAARPPSYVYDDGRAVNVFPDGTPVVEASSAALGTGTFTKATGESSDSDDLSMSTQTMTFHQAESSDSDSNLAWAGTQLDTRSVPADTVRD